jgi:hypothetical protein
MPGSSQRRGTGNTHRRFTSAPSGRCDLGFANVVHQCLGVSVTGGLSAAALATSAVSPAIALKAWEADPLVHCPSNTAMRQQIAAFAKGPKGYKAFLESVAEGTVTSGGNIVVLGYPEMVEDPKLWSKVDQLVGLCQGIRPADAYELRGLAGDLNATIAETVAAVNAEHINDVHLAYIDANTGNPHERIPYTDPDLYQPSTGPRHNVCAAQEWINGITFNVDGLNPENYFNRSFHPNQAGNDAMACGCRESRSAGQEFRVHVLTTHSRGEDVGSPLRWHTAIQCEVPRRERSEVGILNPRARCGCDGAHVILRVHDLTRSHTEDTAGKDRLVGRCSLTVVLVNDEEAVQSRIWIATRRDGVLRPELGVAVGW